VDRSEAARAAGVGSEQLVYDRPVADQQREPGRARSESREVQELRAIKEARPELADAVDMHLELIEIQRRVRTRVPLPSYELSEALLARHQALGTPLFSFEHIPIELTDLRLSVRQTADVLHRYGALEDADFQRAVTLGRDVELLTAAGAWYRRGVRSGVAAGRVPDLAPAEAGDVIDEVLSLAMRPFLSRCAEALQPRPELGQWTHAYCAVCGGEPDFAFITPAADRQLVCGRCTLRWKFAALTCPFCGNSDRALVTSFATPDGQYRVYACDVCHRYLKAYDGRRGSRPVMPMVDSVATLPLDAAAIQRGYSG
jgi:hypothetical protein